MIARFDDRAPHEQNPPCATLTLAPVPTRTRASARRALAMLTAVVTLSSVGAAPVAATPTTPLSDAGRPTSIDETASVVFDPADLEPLDALIDAAEQPAPDLTPMAAHTANTTTAADAEATETERRSVVAVVTTVDGVSVLELESPDPEALSQALLAIDGVVAAEPDGSFVPTGSGTDPYTQFQTHLAAINARPDRSANGTIVAILDSGVSPHPDLPPMAPGYNTVDENTNASAATDHGTMVAGSMTALTGNGIGIDATVEGITIMPVRVCSANACGFADVAEGIIWATDHGARVINVSLGGGFSTSTEAAVNYANQRDVLVVASAGNDGYRGNPVVYPAALSGVLGVGAYRDDAATAWASYGNWVELSAPGERVMTLAARNDGYVLGTGTSFAAPQVAAAAGLLRSIVPAARVADIRAALVGSARDVHTPGWDPQTGAGSLDIANAITVLQARFGGDAAVGRTATSVAGATSLAQIIAAPDYRASDADILRLYHAFFAREPEVDGVRYWIAENRRGVSLDRIAAEFSSSPEFVARYGAGLSDTGFLAVVYRNVLGRDHDQQGFDYWLGQMARGTRRHEVVRYVAAAPEFVNLHPYR